MAADPVGVANIVSYIADVIGCGDVLHVIRYTPAQREVVLRLIRENIDDSGYNQATKDAAYAEITPYILIAPDAMQILTDSTVIGFLALNIGHCMTSDSYYLASAVVTVFSGIASYKYQENSGLGLIQGAFRILPFTSAAITQPAPPAVTSDSTIGSSDKVHPKAN